MMLHGPASFLEPRGPAIFMPSPHAVVGAPKTRPFQLRAEPEKAADWRLIVPVPDGQPATVFMHPPVWIWAAVGTAGTAIAVEFETPFWFRNVTAVNVEKRILNPPRTTVVPLPLTSQ